MVQGKDEITQNIEFETDDKKHFNKWTAVLGICLVIAILASSVLGIMLYQTSDKLKSMEENYNSLAAEHQLLNSTLEQTESDLEEYKSELSKAVSSAKETENSYQSEIKELQDSINSLNSQINSMQTVIEQYTAIPAMADASKRCYLTFDDGPSDNTYKILDILKEKQVKATFFVVGTGKLDYIKRIHEEGHAIGLHSDTHAYAKIYSSQEDFFNDLDSLGNKVEQLVGYRPDIIRFPGGSSNTVSRKYKTGIMSSLVEAVSQRELRYFDWNVDSGDASSNSVPAQTIINNIKSGATGKNNICILMHDTQSKVSTVQALPEVIDHLKAMGYTFDVLSRDSEIFHHSINN